MAYGNAWEIRGRTTVVGEKKKVFAAGRGLSLFGFPELCARVV